MPMLGVGVGGTLVGSALGMFIYMLRYHLGTCARRNYLFTNMAFVSHPVRDATLNFHDLLNPGRQYFGFLVSLDVVAWLLSGGGII